MGCFFIGVDGMARMKLCRCKKLIDPSLGMCEECEVKYRAYRSEYYRQYDDGKDKEISSFYKSVEWLRVRQVVLNKYHGLDVYDYVVNNKITYAETIHHIVEVTDDWYRRLDIGNLIPLSFKNHKVIHELYKKDKNLYQNKLFQIIKGFKLSDNKG